MGSAEVTGADTPERDGDEEVLVDIKGLYHRFKKLWADGGFSGENFEQAAKRLGREIEGVKGSNDITGFEVLPKRWIVERTFGTTFWTGPAVARVGSGQFVCPSKTHRPHFFWSKPIGASNGSTPGNARVPHRCHKATLN